VELSDALKIIEPIEAECLLGRVRHVAMTRKMQEALLIIIGSARDAQQKSETDAKLTRIDTFIPNKYPYAQCLHDVITTGVACGVKSCTEYDCENHQYLRTVSSHKKRLPTPPSTPDDRYRGEERSPYG